MSPRAIIRQLAEPLTDTPVALALLAFWAFAALSQDSANAGAWRGSP